MRLTYALKVASSLNRGESLPGSHGVNCEGHLAPWTAQGFEPSNSWRQTESKKE